MGELFEADLSSVDLGEYGGHDEEIWKKEKFRGHFREKRGLTTVLGGIFPRCIGEKVFKARKFFLRYVFGGGFR